MDGQAVSLRLGEAYAWLGPTARLDEAAAATIVAAARPHAVAALADMATPPALRVAVELVEPATNPGGSLIPAWPVVQPDGSVLIRFVRDWGVMLAAWRELAVAAGSDPDQLDALVRGGERLWIGIANDVLQMYVPTPPPATYSMVRHHALMLAAATLWLGPERAERWRAAHARVAGAFVRSLKGRSPGREIARAERGLSSLLANPASRSGPTETIAWLAADPAAGTAYARYLAAASLGVAALLQRAPRTDYAAWLRRAVATRHRGRDFNRAQIRAFVRSLDRDEDAPR